MIATQEKEGGYLAAIVGYPGAHVRMAHLRVPQDGHVIELFEYVRPTGDRPPLEVRNVGTSHLCFIVDDLARVHAELRDRGVDFVARRWPLTRASTAAATASTCAIPTESRSSSSSLQRDSRLRDPRSGLHVGERGMARSPGPAIEDLWQMRSGRLACKADRNRGNCLPQQASAERRERGRIAAVRRATLGAARSSEIRVGWQMTRPPSAY